MNININSIILNANLTNLAFNGTDKVAAILLNNVFFLSTREGSVSFNPTKHVNTGSTRVYTDEVYTEITMF